MASLTSAITLLFCYAFVIVASLYACNLTAKVIYETPIERKLKRLHSRLHLIHGSFLDEVPEQRMSARFLTGSEKVLELGGNVGRNSLIIASMLHSGLFVSLETDKKIAQQLRENRDANGLNFFVENAALSARPLIQKGWNSKPSNVLIPGYEWVATITYQQLLDKYRIEFDTLVIDCEGAFYYTLMDMPEVVKNMNLIIMKNDYDDIRHKKYVDRVLKDSGFHRVYSEAGGWGPCTDFFFETWKKDSQ